MLRAEDFKHAGFFSLRSNLHRLLEYDRKGVLSFVFKFREHSGVRCLAHREIHEDDIGPVWQASDLDVRRETCDRFLGGG